MLSMTMFECIIVLSLTFVNDKFIIYTFLFLVIHVRHKNVSSILNAKSRSRGSFPVSCLNFVQFSIPLPGLCR